MKKKQLTIGLILVLIAISLSLIYKISNGVVRQNQIQESIKTLPNFNFLKDSTTIFTEKDINPNHPTLILHFSLDCDFCHKEIEYINKRRSDFSNVNVLLVSSSSYPDLKNLKRSMNINEAYNNIHFLNDNQSFYQTFGVSVVPSIFIYDKRNKLVKQFIGETKPETLLKYLNKV